MSSLRFEKIGISSGDLSSDELISKPNLMRLFGCSETELSEAATLGEVAFKLKERVVKGFEPLEVIPIRQIPSLIQGIQRIASQEQHTKKFEWVTTADVMKDFTLHPPTNFTIIFHYN